MSAEGGTKAVLTTQACEKIYRSNGPDADVETRLHVEEGAALAWFPQETILFDGSRLKVKGLDYPVVSALAAALSAAMKQQNEGGWG